MPRGYGLKAAKLGHIAFQRQLRRKAGQYLLGGRGLAGLEVDHFEPVILCDVEPVGAASQHEITPAHRQGDAA